MGDDQLRKKKLESQMQGKTPVGKPQQRWNDAVTEDVSHTMGIRGWQRHT